jgi:hypothetical protein
VRFYFSEISDIEFLVMVAKQPLRNMARALKYFNGFFEKIS